MKRFLFAFTAMAMLFAGGVGPIGCVGPEKIGMIGVDQGWKVIGPRYRAYVEADPKLASRPEIKADWLKTADKMDRAIAEALKAR